jgi:predicted nucleic acid-binding Zn ribbon protein
MKKDSTGKRKAEVSSLKDCISELLDTYRLRGKFSQTQIITSWEKLMGQTIAKRTTDIFFRDGKLFVKLSSGPLKQELQLSKSKIIKMLNAEVGMDLIDDVIFL